MAGLMGPHSSTDTLRTHIPSEGSALRPPALCSLPHAAAGPPAQHLQGTRSAHCQPEGAPRDCLFKLTFWGQESYFQLFQRQYFHHSLSASAGGRDALPRGAMAGGFGLRCSAPALHHWVILTPHPAAYSVPGANRPRSRWEKTSLGSHLGTRVRSIPPGRGAGGRHRAETGGCAPTQDIPSISKVSFPHILVRQPQK